MEQDGVAGLVRQGAASAGQEPAPGDVPPAWRSQAHRLAAPHGAAVFVLSRVGRWPSSVRRLGHRISHGSRASTISRRLAGGPALPVLLEYTRHSVVDVCVFSSAPERSRIHEWRAPPFPAARVSILVERLRV